MQQFLWLFPIMAGWATSVVGYLSESLPQNDVSIRRPAGISQSMANDGWIALFDGQTKFGWTGLSAGAWNVEPNSPSLWHQGNSNGLLRTTAQFDDFDLLLEFKIAANSTGAVYVRTSPEPRHLDGDTYGIRLSTVADSALQTGALMGRQPVQTPALKKDTQWHRLRVRTAGAEIQTWVDGNLVCQYCDPRPLGRGYIGLEVLDGKIEFRNLRLKPSNQMPLLRGRNLARWTDDQKLTSRFLVNDDQELVVKGGRGQLESRSVYGDFVFSFQCKTNATGLNSGLFFRCIPGDLMNGYECQVHNGFQNDDRKQPSDCGTGGIFRRSNARWVNANDQQWFATTIVTTGPRVGVWVNGYQVTDWVDRRRPDPNPRRGYRPAPGTLAIQGHDPTTDLKFRSMQIRELTIRRPQPSSSKK